MVFHRILSDIKFLLVSRTFFCILFDFRSAVVWQIKILPLISTLSSLFYRFLKTISMALTTISITVTVMLYNIFSSLARSEYLLIFSLSLLSLSGLLVRKNSRDDKFFSCLLKLGQVLWSGLGDPFLSQRPDYFYHFYFTPWKFFISALADGLSLESEYQQVPSSHQHYYYYYYYYYTPLRVFQTSISWLSSIRVWMIASFFKSLGLFSVFWTILIML